MRKIIFIAVAVAFISSCTNSITQKKAIIELEVNGKLWKRVSSLNNSAPDDTHYVVRTNEEGMAVVIFGDGKHGAIPASGKSIKVTFPAHKCYRGVYLQQGRALIEND